MHFYPILRTGLVILLLCGIAAFGFAGCTLPKKEKADGKSCTLSFHSFDGGGPSYSVSIEDKAVLSCTSERRYNKSNHEELDGAGYDVIFTFTGLRSGSTTVTIQSESPIIPTETMTYSAVVDDTLHVTLTLLDSAVEDDPMQPVPALILYTQNKTVYPSIADTAAAQEFISQLSREPIEIPLQKNETGYSGDLPWALDQPEETITANRGDLVLTDGGRIVLCTAGQSGSFSRLASLSEDALQALLPFLEEETTVSLWVEWSE